MTTPPGTATLLLANKGTLCELQWINRAKWVDRCMYQLLKVTTSHDRVGRVDSCLSWFLLVFLHLVVDLCVVVPKHLNSENISWNCLDGGI